MILEDDKHVFPAGNVIFVTKKTIAEEAGPDYEKTIVEVQKGLTLAVMQELDARVELEKETAKEAAAAVPRRKPATPAGGAEMPARAGGAPAPARSRSRAKQMRAAQAAARPETPARSQREARVIGLRPASRAAGRRSASSRGRRPSRAPSPGPASSGSTASCRVELIVAAKVDRGGAEQGERPGSRGRGSASPPRAAPGRRRPARRAGDQPRAGAPAGAVEERADDRADPHRGDQRRVGARRRRRS